MAMYILGTKASKVGELSGKLIGQLSSAGSAAVPPKSFIDCCLMARSLELNLQDFRIPRRRNMNWRRNGRGGKVSLAAVLLDRPVIFLRLHRLLVVSDAH